MVSVIKSQNHNTLEEDHLIKAIESKKFNKEAIEKLANDKDIQASQMVNLRVYLLEKR